MSIESSLNFRQVSETVTTSGTVPAESLVELRTKGYDLVINLLPDRSKLRGRRRSLDHRWSGCRVCLHSGRFRHTEPRAIQPVRGSHGCKRRQDHPCAFRGELSVDAFYSLYAMREGWWSTEQADEHLKDIWTQGDYPVWSEFIAAERARMAR